MKIVLFAPHLAPEFEGGTELVARAQARELARRGHDVKVVCGSDVPAAPDSGALAPERFELDGFPVVRLRRTPAESYDLRLARPRLARACAAEVAGADLAHVHHWSTFSSDLVRSLAIHAPTVVTLHDHLASCPRFFRAPPRATIVCPPRGEFAPCAACLRPELPDGVDAEQELAERARDFALELAAAALVVAPSEHHAARCAATLDLGGRAIEVVPHGFCRELFHRALALPAPWSGDRPLRVLHFGNLGEAKGTGDLVAALRDLPAGSVELLLAGRVLEPADEARWRAAAGHLPLRAFGGFDHLATLEGVADLAAFPSRLEESYGLVVDEALALGLPTWVSDRGAPAERVGDAGAVLPAEDPTAWRGAFEALLEDPAILGAQRGAIGATLHTAAEAAAQLESAYERVLAARS